MSVPRMFAMSMERRNGRCRIGDPLGCCLCRRRTEHVVKGCSTKHGSAESVLRVRELLPVRLVIPVPAPPHLLVGRIVLVLAKEHVRFEMLKVSVRKPNVPLAQMPARHQPPRPFIRSIFLDRKSTRLNSSHVSISYAV